MEGVERKKVSEGKEIFEVRLGFERPEECWDEWVQEWLKLLLARDLSLVVVVVRYPKSWVWLARG